VVTRLAARQAQLRGLVADGTIRMVWAPEVMERPAPFADTRVAADRIRGMLLGLAIGDALGNTSEGMLPHARRMHFGDVRDYRANRHAGGARVGLPSDDTQLAFWTLEHLLEHGRIEPDALARLFCSRRIFGVGGTVKAFVEAWRQGRDWRLAAQPSAGNGALMRIAPVLVPHLADGSAELWLDAVLGTAVTHNDHAAIGSSVGFVGMWAELLLMSSAPAPDWWVETYIARAGPIEGDRTRYEPRGGPLAGKWSGPLWRFVEQHVPAMADVPSIEAQDTWYSGAYLLETVPTVLHILMRHAQDPEEAIVRAVSDTKDNDTIAAIVGATVGALHGESALPGRWRDGLLGRVIADVDDRRAYDLLDGAIRRGPFRALP
jgi:ADP-ribosyl-[dinitrogen reductase] hydrolase